MMLEINDSSEKVSILKLVHLKHIILRNKQLLPSINFIVPLTNQTDQYISNLQFEVPFLLKEHLKQLYMNTKKKSTLFIQSFLSCIVTVQDASEAFFA